MKARFVFNPGNKVLSSLRRKARETAGRSPGSPVGAGHDRFRTEGCLEHSFPIEDHGPFPGRKRSGSILAGPYVCPRSWPKPAGLDPRIPKTHRAITVKKADGSDYVPHTPVDPAQPGWYFHTVDGEHCFEVDGREMLVWGNYCNVIGGAVPVNIYYSTDNGETVKLAYSFGQNKHFQQPGAAPDAPLLGDPSNKFIARHFHCVTFNPAEKAFYACTGDLDRGDGHECHWLRGTYDAKADAWDWKVIISVNSNSRYKCGGINFVDGRLYWISDANGQTIRGTYDRGIFSCAPADIADKEKHTLLFNPGFESGNMLIEDGVIIATHCAPASTYACGIIYSPDMGKTWAQFDLKEFGPRSGCRIHKKNSDGWFRLDLRKGWIDRAEVIFIKPKTR